MARHRSLQLGNESRFLVPEFGGKLVATSSGIIVKSNYIRKGCRSPFRGKVSARASLPRNKVSKSCLGL